MLKRAKNNSTIEWIIEMHYPTRDKKAAGNQLVGMSPMQS